jgi:hypothetical protein
MNPYVRRLSVGAAGIAVATSMAACGNNVTGPANWHALVTETVNRVWVSNNSYLQYDKLAGALVDSKNRPVARTQFRESCNRLYVDGKLKRDWNCLAIVYTGHAIYVAGGHADGVIGELPVLANPKVGGKLRIILQGSAAAAGHDGFKLQIVSVPGGRG